MFVNRRTGQNRSPNQASKYDYELLEKSVRQSQKSTQATSMNKDGNKSSDKKATSLRNSLAKQEANWDTLSMTASTCAPDTPHLATSSTPRELRSMFPSSPRMHQTPSFRGKTTRPPSADACTSLRKKSRHEEKSLDALVNTEYNGQQRRGKLVRVDPYDSTADSRGGSSMKGPLVVKEQDEMDLCESLSRKIASEANDNSVKFNGFTDRFVRSQDGLAMGTVFAGMRRTDHQSSDTQEPDCPMNAALLPPAGQVCQVAVGSSGKPPYVLQAECDGVMPMVDRTWARHMYKARPGSPAPISSSQAQTDDSLTPRGCERSSTKDKELQSHNIRSLLCAVETPEEDLRHLHQQGLGDMRKGMVSQSAFQHNTNFVYDDAEPISHRYGKNYSSRIHMRHNWSATGGQEKTVHEPQGHSPRADGAYPEIVSAGSPSFGVEATKLRSKSPGEFNGKFSHQSKKLNMTMADHLRFADPEHPPGKDYSARVFATHHWAAESGGVKRCYHSKISPVRIGMDADNQSPEKDSEARLRRSRSCPPPRDDLVLRKNKIAGESRHAGVPSASSGTDRLGHGKRVLANETLEKTGRILKPLGVEHTQHEHHCRMRGEEGYAKACELVREHSRSSKRAAKEIKENCRVSSGVANAMMWD